MSQPGTNSQQQAASSGQVQAAAAAAPPPAANGGSTNGGTGSRCLPHVLEAIYGKQQNKKAAYEHSLQRWWTEYADRKNDEEDEYVANSLLYDRNHLPRTAPAPECVQRAMAAAAAGQAADKAAAAGDAAQPSGAS